MEKVTINTVLQGMNGYTLQAIGNDNLSINTLEGLPVFLYFSEEQQLIVLYSFIAKMDSMTDSQKAICLKNLLALNLPLASKFNVRLGMDKKENLFLSAVINADEFSQDIFGAMLKNFLPEAKRYQNSVHKVVMDSINNVAVSSYSVSPSASNAAYDDVMEMFMQNGIRI